MGWLQVSLLGPGDPLGGMGTRGEMGLGFSTLQVEQWGSEAPTHLLMDVPRTAAEGTGQAGAWPLLRAGSSLLSPALFGCRLHPNSHQALLGADRTPGPRGPF